MTYNSTIKKSLFKKINILSQQINKCFKHPKMEFLERNIIFTAKEISNELINGHKKEFSSFLMAKELCYNLCTMIDYAEDKRLINLNIFSILLSQIEELEGEIDDLIEKKFKSNYKN